MYNCDKCSSVIPANTSELRLVTETRLQKHPARKDAFPRMRKVNKCTVCKETEMKHRHLDHRFVSPADDPGGEGLQIVREVRVCPTCYGAA